jgi:hypothetical protein
MSSAGSVSLRTVVRTAYAGSVTLHMETLAHILRTGCPATRQSLEDDGLGYSEDEANYARRVHQGYRQYLIQMHLDLDDDSDDDLEDDLLND